MKLDFQLRSLLLIPANKDNFIEKALELDADMLLMDCNVSVADEEKTIARENIKRFMHVARHHDRLVCAQVNSFESQWFLDEIIVLAEAGVDAFMSSDIRNQRDVTFLHRLLTSVEVKLNLDRQLGIVPLITSPIGLMNLAEICEASDRIIAVSFGCDEYLGESNKVDDTQLISLDEARKQVVEPALNAGVIPIDHAYDDHHDIAGLEREVKEASEIGFMGKIVVHPSQLKIVNEGFDDKESKILRANRVLNLYRQALKNHRDVPHSPEIVKQAIDTINKQSTVFK